MSPSVRPEPRIRANWARFAVEALDKLPRQQSGPVLGAVPEEDLARIREAGTIALIPFESYRRVADAIFRAFGNTRAVNFWCDTFSQASQNRLLFAPIRAALKLGGFDPRKAVGMAVGSAWSFMTKDCGSMESIGEQGGWFGYAWKDIPPEFAQCESLCAAGEGGVRSAFLILGSPVESRSERRAGERRFIHWVKLLPAQSAPG